VAANVLGKAKDRVTVQLPGGKLKIQWNGSNRLYMVGPAAEVFRGNIDV